MKYSYGDRRFVLSKQTSYSLFQWWVYLSLVTTISHRHTGTFLSYIIIPMFALATVGLLQWLMSKRHTIRDDLPDSLEITDDGTLHLYHGPDVYAERSSLDVSFFDEEIVTVLPLTQVSVAKISFNPASGPIDHIYVLPYLNGYSAFIEQLRSISPSISPLESQIEWGESTSFRGATLISFHPGYLMLNRGKFRGRVVKPEDILSIDLIPPGKRPERHLIRLTDGSFEVSPETYKDYADTIQRLKAFAGQPIGRR